ncbi:MAG TPA: hypothetical protein VF240_03600 [Pyrinomonadaceae bacterium]
MGNPLGSSARVLSRAALANADKADGGFSPLAVTAGALGSPDLIAHDDALYDRGVVRVITNLPGGTLEVFQGTIVPWNAQEKQITEAKFLDVLAEELARRLIGIGHGDGPDPEFVAVARGMLERFIATLIPPGARMERVLRAALNLPADLNVPVHVTEFVSGLLSKVTPLIENLETILRLAEELERMEGARSPDDLEQAALRLFMSAGVMYLPPIGGPKKWSFREFVTKVGNRVHTLLQAHYWLAHPNDVIMFEDFIVAGPNLLLKIWDAGTWKAPYDFMVALRVALMGKTRPGQDTGSTKRPDILNLTRQHLYEIKTVSQVLDGVRQVADYQRRLAAVGITVHLAGMGPADWRPFPLYYVGGTTVVAVEAVRPGVIAYQRIGSRVPVTNPLRFWSQESLKYQQRQAQRAQAVQQGALVAVALIGTLLLAVALAPAAVAIGGAAIAGTGAEAALGLGVASGLTFAL